MWDSLETCSWSKGCELDAYFVSACLKILGPEKLQNLELPETPEQNLPVKKVVHRSSLPHLEDDVSSQTKNSRFNSFTGYQTPEREESFKLKEITTVHCGFYNENGGFRVSDVDKDYMRSRRVVVATCAFGGDDLHQPIGMTEVSIKKVCYVAFWDEVTRAAQQEEGNRGWTMTNANKIGPKYSRKHYQGRLVVFMCIPEMKPWR